MSASRPDRLIAATWADAAPAVPVTLTIVAIDRQGLVRDIGDLLAAEKMSIEMMHTTTDRTQSTATIDVRLGIGRRAASDTFTATYQDSDERPFGPPFGLT
jgi:GTP pyrophosphokinase